MRISVITAVYNGMPFIEDCLLSVASQSHPDIEHIVVDGGSTDGTVDVIKRYEDRIARWTTGPDRGMYDALNKGIGMATGDAIGMLNSDDTYEGDDVIETVARCLDEKAVDSCYGDLVYVGRDDPSRVIRLWRSSSYVPGLLRRGWMPPHPSFFCRRSAYEKWGGFDTSFRIAADYELMVRLLSRGRTSTCHIPRVLVRMRTGGISNRSVSAMIKKSIEDYRVIRMHGLGGFGTLLMKNLSKVPQFFRGGRKAEWA